MKLIYLLALLCSMGAAAQITIEKIDGTKINASEVRFNADYEKLVYKFDCKKKKLKYKQLSAVTSDKFTFRYFKSGKKHHGYFLKTESAGKTLAFLVYTPSAGSTTGFSAIKRVAIAIFNNNGDLIEEFSISQGQSEKDIQQRHEVAEKIQQDSKDCAAFIEEISAYLKVKPDEKMWRIGQYFIEKSNPVNCN